MSRIPSGQFYMSLSKVEHGGLLDDDISGLLPYTEVTTN